MTNLLIAEDNAILSSHYQQFLTKDKNINIVGQAFDGNTALDLYIQYKPDIFVLDLKLPKISGLDIIEQLSQYENDNNKCNIIVISGNPKLRHKLLNTKKIYKIIPKPFNLTIFSKTIQDFIDENSKKFPLSILKDLLLQLNLNPNSKYLIDIIKIGYFEPDMLENFKHVYCMIAQKYNCSYETIRSNIRSLIRTVTRFATDELLISIFYFSKRDINKILSPKYFINCIINYLNK